MKNLSKSFEEKYEGTQQHKSIKTYEKTSLDRGEKLLKLVGKELGCEDRLLNLQHEKGNGILKHKGIYYLYKQICKQKEKKPEFIYTGRELRKRSKVEEDIEAAGRDYSYLKKLDVLEGDNN